MTETKIKLTCDEEGKHTEGYAVRYDIPKGERVARALKMLGILWFIMFIVIFVPVLHFVLVPLFFVLGLVLATTTYLETGMVTEGKIKCPNCSAEIVFEKESESWPRVQRCPGCSFTLKIQAPDQQLAAPKPV
jgi:hypothetical protein